MNELDDLLKTLRAEEPKREDVTRWKAAIGALRRRKASRWIELVAAVMVGVLIGGTVFHRPAEDNNSEDHATIERVITKIE